MWYNWKLWLHKEYQVIHRIRKIKIDMQCLENRYLRGVDWKILRKQKHKWLFPWKFEDKTWYCRQKARENKKTSK